MKTEKNYVKHAIIRQIIFSLCWYKMGINDFLTSDSMFIKVSVLVYFILECLKTITKSRIPQINFHCEKKH